MVVLGVEKVGKSTFAAGAGSPIFIPVKLEEGVDSIDVPKFPAVQTFEELMEAIEVLKNEDHEFETVVIDSASAVEPLIWECVCREHGVRSIEQVGGGYGKGYLESLYKWQDLMNALDELRSIKDMASVLIGHVKVKRFDDPERPSYDQYQFDVNEKVAAALYRWADFIGFANIAIDLAEEKVGFNKTKVKATQLEVGARVLHTQKTPAHPGGGRGVYGRLPDTLPLDWSEFQSAVVELSEDKPLKKKKPR
jgi:hypothetical protein